MKKHLVLYGDDGCLHEATAADIGDAYREVMEQAGVTQPKVEDWVTGLGRRLESMGLQIQNHTDALFTRMCKVEHRLDALEHGKGEGEGESEVKTETKRGGLYLYGTRICDVDIESMLDCYDKTENTEHKEIIAAEIKYKCKRSKPTARAELAERYLAATMNMPGLAKETSYEDRGEMLADAAVQLEKAWPYTALVLQRMAYILLNAAKELPHDR
jgi:hypothetical protein